MRRSVVAGLVMTCALTPVSALTAHAQEGQHLVEFWGAWAGWSGDDAGDARWGPGTGVQALFDLGWFVDVGGDAGFLVYDSGNTDLGDAYEFEVSAVARRGFGSANVRPFAGLRAGYTRLSAEFEDFRFEQNGFLFGPGAGIEVPLNNRLRLVGTGEALRYWYSNARIFLVDIEAPDSGGSAWRFLLRLGLAFRWPLPR